MTLDEFANHLYSEHEDMLAKSKEAEGECEYELMYYRQGVADAYKEYSQRFARNYVEADLPAVAEELVSRLLGAGASYAYFLGLGDVYKASYIQGQVLGLAYIKQSVLEGE